MPTWTWKSLHRFRSLLSLITYLHLSARRVALTLHAQCILLWRSILRRCRCQSQIRLHASVTPVVPVNDSSKEERPHVDTVRADHPETPAPPSAQRATASGKQDEPSKQQAPASISYQFKFEQIPATPEKGSRRYEVKTVSRDAKSPSVLPGQRQFLSTSPLIDGWRQFVHPEGNVLFYHESLRIYTENDITDRKQAEQVLCCAKSLVEQATDASDVIIDELTELVINVDDARRCHYYFVDHTNRLLFWVDQVSVTDLGTHLQGITQLSHIRYLIESQYWYAATNSLPGTPFMFCFFAFNVIPRSHCEFYPYGCTLSKGVFDDLRGMLNYAKTDMMTTDTSSSPFAQDELVAILDIVNSLKDDGKIADPYSVWIIARLMTFFTENQFLNFCGQPCARLNADTPLFGQQTWNRHIIFKLVSWFLFGSPSDHAVRLQRIWVDGIIIQPRWKDYVNRLTGELARYTIFSTVMLAVNFSFLAVPGVVTPYSAASMIQIILYCSVVSTTASIAFSFVLLNVYSNPGLLVAGPAAEVMWTLSKTKAGMACLAITHGLPLASLIWSITFFSVALAVQIFSPRELATVATLGIECLIIALFGVVTFGVTRLFAGSDDSDEDEADAPHEEARPLVTSQYDVELGPRS